MQQHAATRATSNELNDESAQTLELLGVGEPPPNPHELSPAPIPSDWILEGQPVARTRLLHRTSDRLARSYMWDCTAGRFNWHYDVDEMICLLEGSITLLDASNRRHHLRAGDTFFFPRGSSFEWHVTNYVRKIAYIHDPLSKGVLLLKRALARVQRLIGLRASTVNSSFAD